ncbi:hypothetical protein [Actinoplanes sp. NPDC049599]|uniref:hypothetical protein n=1 Tax=Actinoplanes sp. NPDC049599 TaxID=3363903 RepID=UPI003799CC77
MTIRFFQIRSPRPDFTGRIGSVSFADGLARVSFDDARDDDGLAKADEHQVQVGRSAVLFAQRRPGYVVTEVDAAGNPIEPAGELSFGFAPSPAGDMPTRSASKADWLAYATSPAGGMTADAADALTRDQLAEKFLGPKES